MPFFWSVFCLLTVSGTPCPAKTAAFYPVEQAAPWRARHLLTEKPGKFSPENLRDKMPRKAFYPAFRGLPSGRYPSGTCSATPPIPARIFSAKGIAIDSAIPRKIQGRIFLGQCSPKNFLNAFSFYPKKSVSVAVGINPLYSAYLEPCLGVGFGVEFYQLNSAVGNCRKK